MKKNSILMSLILSVALSASAWAETTLKIPVRTEEDVSAAQINRQLKVAGIQESLPLYFEVSSDEQSADKKYEKLAQDVSRLTALLGDESSLMTESIPNSAMHGTCYTGVGGQAVVDTVFLLAGSFYSEQMNLWGWKYKQKTYINPDYFDPYDPAEANATLNKRSRLWRNWRGLGEAMLIVLAYGDNGDDVNDVIVPRCK